jgi:hypothetical protein
MRLQPSFVPVDLEHESFRKDLSLFEGVGTEGLDS